MLYKNDSNATKIIGEILAQRLIAYTSYLGVIPILATYNNITPDELKIAAIPVTLAFGLVVNFYSSKSILYSRLKKYENIKYHHVPRFLNQKELEVIKKKHVDEFIITEKDFKKLSWR